MICDDECVGDVNVCNLWRCLALTCLSHLKLLSNFSQFTYCDNMRCCSLSCMSQRRRRHVNVVNIDVGFVSSVTIAIVGWRLYCLQLCLAAYQDCAATRASRRICWHVDDHQHLVLCGALRRDVDPLLIQCSQLAAIWHKLQLLSYV